MRRANSFVYCSLVLTFVVVEWSLLLLCIFKYHFGLYVVRFGELLDSRIRRFVRFEDLEIC